MTDPELAELIDSTLRPFGVSSDLGEDYRDPPLDILGYYRRPTRFSSLPILGRGLSVVVLVRQPVDIGFPNDYAKLVDRLARAVEDRYPPWGKPGGLAIGLTALVLTPEPILASDDQAIAKVLGDRRRRSRSIPLGLIRINLGQQAMAFSLVAGPAGVFVEPEAIVDALTPHFRRYVPFVTF